MALRFLLLLVGLVGCGGVTTGEVPVDAAVDALDASSETGVVDTAVCVVGAIEKAPCGACGTRSRECLPGGRWSELSKCLGEAAAPQCAPGESKTVPCGNCGRQTNECDSSTCMWREGACFAEGECTPGEVQTTSASCSDPSVKRTRTCSSECKWGPFSTCS